MSKQNNLIEYFDTREINSKILELWTNSSIPGTLQQEFNEPNQLAPLLYPKLKKKQVLFVGFNPSFSPKTLAKRQGLTQEELWKFYDPENSENKDYWISEVELATKKYSYFGKFDPITDYLNRKIPNEKFDWEHIDLLLVRKTQQNELLKQLSLDKTDNPHQIQDPLLREFVLSQIELMKELLTELEPRIIIVVNAKASKMFKNVMSHSRSEKHGCYLTKINTKPTQTHLSGMITGQRALDNESFCSLKWNIGHSFRSLGGEI